MRILMVARRYWPAVGGAESYLRHVATALAAHHDVTVLAQRIDDGPTGRLSDSLAPPPPFDSFSDGSVYVEQLRIPLVRRALLAPLVFQVTPVLRRYAYGRARLGATLLYRPNVAPLIARSLPHADVVHMWGGDLLATAAMDAAAGMHAPGVVTPFAHRGQWGDDPASVFAYRRASRVVALLEADAEFYRELGVRHEQIAVGGACSPGVSAGGGGSLRTRHGIGGPLVLFLGVRRPYKGFDLLLAAAEHVASEMANVTFVFAGPGEHVVAPAGARVLDAGVVDDAERAGWLDAADLLCLPSEGEIFPVSILEAWSVGTPVVTSDLPTLRELVGLGGGVAAKREPLALASAIVELLAEPTRMRALGEQGRSIWRERYTVEAIAAWHAALYESLVAEEAVCAA